MSDARAPAAAGAPRRWWAPWIVAVALLVAVASYLGRRALIAGFFRDGVPAAAPWQRELTGPSLPAAPHVRVVLLDGLSRALAQTLPNLNRACEGGLTLAVDVGFPTVSLPVQHVLWTGRTQQQSGVLYRIPRLDPPPVDALPLRVADAIAVGESHRDIVHSFGFATTLPPLGRDDIEPVGSRWRTEEFVPAATAAVASDARLAFVHVLRIDEAGHREGAGSQAYDDAAREADAMLAEWFAAAPDDARWIVLADHGHREAGGHGGAESEIRVVRACIFGGAPLQLPEPTAPIHLVDLHRALADMLGLEPDADAPGRALATAIDEPRVAQTLPRPSPVAWVTALAVLAAGVLLGAAPPSARAALPWLPLAAASVWLVDGAITLSNPVVYPPLGRDVLLAAMPGFAWLLLWSAAARDARTLACAAAPACATLVAAAILAGVPAALVGGPPPLVPTWTAWCSVLFTITAGGALAVAIGQGIAWGRRPRSATAR